MKNICLYICFTIIFGINSLYACDVEIITRQINGLRLSAPEVQKEISQAITLKDYKIVLNNGEYTIKLILSKGQSLHTSGEYFAKSSLSLYKDSQLLNYAYGEGKHFKDQSQAYIYDQYKTSIQNAAKHLPTCGNLIWP